MRIVAGTRKGLAIRAPAGRSVRPTPMRVREAAMSILGGALDGERVLDLCAGSGSMGLELLSRGAGHAVFVEPDPAVRVVLESNIARAGFGPRARVVAEHAEPALARLGREGAAFDLVWLDPPWRMELHRGLLQALARVGVLAAGGEVWVESERGIDDAWLPSGWERRDLRRYGSVTLERIGPGEAP